MIYLELFLLLLYELLLYNNYNLSFIAFFQKQFMDSPSILLGPVPTPPIPQICQSRDLSKQTFL